MERYFQKNKQTKWKHHISSSHADMRCAISTKFCTVIEVLLAIILGYIRFWIQSIVSPLGVVENLAENDPISKLLIILSFIEIKKQPNLAKLCTLSTHINCVNLIKIVQGTRPLGAIILVKFQFFSVLGVVNPQPWADQGEIWQAAPLCQISPWSVQHVAPAGRKTPKLARE